MRLVSLAVAAACSICGCTAVGDNNVPIENGTVRIPPARGTGEERKASVTMPHTWMHANQALIAAYRQVGLRYAVVVPRFETPVGPFAIDKPIDVDALVARIADASGTEAHWVNDVVVFDPRVDVASLKSVTSSAGWKNEGDRKVWLFSSPAAYGSSTRPARWGRDRVQQLGDLGHSAAIPELSMLAGSADGSVRMHALAAMQRLEGDFMVNTWPGRLSIYEVLADKLDRDAMLYALEEGGPTGGRVWKMAAELLGRAREPNLTRGVWWDIWNKYPGTIQMTLWAMGRCGDPGGRGSLEKRISKTFTNNETDRYLAAIALGEIDAISTLAQHTDDADVDVRRAAAMGLGLCSSKDKAAKALEPCLKDADQSVQFIACQSLGRLGEMDKLGLILLSTKDDQLWAAALDACAERPTFRDWIEDGSTGISLLPGGESRPSEGDPVRTAAVAEAYGRFGGGLAAGLSDLLDHKDRWVRAAAAEGLAKLGTADAIAAVAAIVKDPTADADVRIAGIIGLGRSLAPGAAEPLFVVAGNPNEHYRLRQYAVLALTRLANRAGQKKIEQLVDPASPLFLAFAVRHVRFATPKETAQHVIPLLTKGDRDTACAAAGCLTDLGYGPAVRELLEGSDIFDNHTRMMHCWGAIRSEGPEATAALIDATDSRRRLIRQGAALALGQRRTPKAVDALLRLANDQNAGVRAAAAQSLGMSADPLAIPVLVRLAESDPDQRVRTEAIRGLRSRDFASDPQTKDCFAGLAGNDGDAGGLDPNKPSVAAQEGQTFVLRAWSQEYDEDLVSNLTYETTMCYDPFRGRTIMWGAHGRRYDSPQTGQTWFFDAADADWTRPLGSRQWPNGSCCNRQIVFDAANRLAVVPKSGGGGTGGHGWLNGLRGNLTYSIPWALDARADQWYPMRPVENPGGLGMVGGTFDARRGLAVWWWGRLAAYDGYANEWIRLRPPGAAPGYEGNSSIAFDPKTGLLIAVASSGTWSYDPATNKWTDLRATGDPAPTGAPMVYDSANDVMLALLQAGQGPMRVWVYHIRDRRWEKLPVAEPAPRYGTMFDCVYDAKNNVVVISGNESMSWSGALTVRETWTYRYQRAEPKPEAAEDDPPRDVKVAVADDGTATVTWTAPRGEGVTGYIVLRKVAANPVEGEWQAVGKTAADVLTYTDKNAPGRALTFYAVAAERKDKPGSLLSPPARTAAPAPRWATAVVTGGGIRLTWQAAEAEDVVGYHVYRATADLRWPWHDRFDPASNMGELKRITAAPVKEAELLDAEAKVEGPASELAWPKTFAYVVRAVNAWGVEGGPSPVTVALPDVPGPVRVIPWLDGRRLVVWNPSRADADLAGYHVMRMDDWNRDYCFRWQAAPVAGTAFFDDEEAPRADRRRYYISGVDVMGTVGIPSSGEWSHGFP